MRNLFSELERPLPELLHEHLQELLAWDNNCRLTWMRLEDPAQPESQRWFSVALNGHGRQWALRLEFWIPEWMNERGVAAILPARLPVSACETGRCATAELRRRSWPELRASLPGVARTCARLMNELWGRTEADAVLLRGVEYQGQLEPVPFPDLLDRH